MSTTTSWIKIGVVAARLGLSVSTIRRMTAQGQLPCVTTLAGTRLFDPAVIDRMATMMRCAAQKGAGQ